MRYRIQSNAGLIAMLAVALFSVATYITNDLRLYIHPRYFVFTLIMSVVAITMAFFSKLHTNEKVATSLVVSCLLGVLLLFMPPAVLSSRLADTRAGSGTLALKADTQKITITSRNSEKLKFEDWTSLIAQDPSGALVVGKKVKVSGFVRAGGNDDILALSRFVVTCCAVDARPIELDVYLPNWQDIYTPDSWVEVQGVFEPVEGRLVLKPSAHIPIEEPESPYAY